MLFINSSFYALIIYLPCSDIAVKHLICETEIFLIRFTAEPVNRRFINQNLGYAQLPANLFYFLHSKR